MKLYGTQAGMYFFINDHLGTPQKIVNNSGQVVWSAAYLPFGKAQVTAETVANNFRFPGQYFDAESGLHYNWHRYYDPETGRYITADPIGLEGGINLYAYVMGNPVNRVDPNGLLNLGSALVGGAIGGIFGGLGAIGTDHKFDAFMGGFAAGFFTGMFDPTPGFGAVITGLSAAAGAAAAAINGCGTGGILGTAIGAAIGGYYGSKIPGIGGTVAGGVLGGGLGWVGAILGDGCGCFN